MRLTRAERKAAMAVAGMTVAVVVSGVKLLRKHTRYMTQKAAAFFRDSQMSGPEGAAKEDRDDAETAQKTQAAGTAGDSGCAEQGK